LKISEMQIRNFPELILNKNKIVQNRNERKIFTTFRMEDVERKIKEQQEKLDLLKRQKDEFEKLKKLEESKLQEKLNLTKNGIFTYYFI